PAGDGNLPAGDRDAELAGGGGAFPAGADGVRGGVAGVRARGAAGGLMGALAFRTLVAALFLFLLAPGLLVFPMSVSAAPFLTWPPSGFSLQWYAALTQEPKLAEAARNSLALAIVVTALSLAAAMPAALALARIRFSGREALLALLTAPLLLPTIVLGLALLI